MIVQNGQYNAAAMGAPGVIVNIIPPALTSINGVSTNIIGFVGSCTWGPTNGPILSGSLGQVFSSCGNISNSKYDLVTAAAIASQQGASNFITIRVTDGSDKAATYDIMDTASTPLIGVTLTAKYTGTTGNTITVTTQAGTVTGSFTVMLQRTGYVAEVYSNITGTGAAFWTNLANAINNGTQFRGPSQICTAAVGTSTTPSPEIITAVPLAGGTDGISSLADSNLLGTDGLAGSRTGMYALDGSGASLGVLCGFTTSSDWNIIGAWAEAHGIYMFVDCASGTALSANVTTIQSAGVSPYYGLKVFAGDWIQWYDYTNQLYRFVPPSFFSIGQQGNATPNNSSLNKTLNGIVTSQSQINGLQYSSADILLAAQNGLDIIAFPSPGGNYWSCQNGVNANVLNPIQTDDSYTRMTNFIAETINQAFGIFIGQFQNTSTWTSAANMLSGFLLNLQNLGLIGSPFSTSAYSVQINAANNPVSQTSLGLTVATVSVSYLGIIKRFLVNYQGGSNVVVTQAAA